jgi:DNA helicase-2/ATP-dependent DNA helicase PcrA
VRSAFARGAVVLPAYLAKGLEFDVVILYHAGEYIREEERLLLYTACTRALHVLCVYYCGSKSPLLPESI